MSDDSQVIADLAAQVAEPVRISSGRVEGGEPDLYVYLRREDQATEIVDLERYQPVPSRKCGQVLARTPASLVEYVLRHKDEQRTTLWSNVERGQVAAVLDDHSTGPAAGWGEHRAVLLLAQTADWKHWTSADGELMTQAKFAEHLEDGAEAVVDPDAATMLEIAQSFHAKRGVNFRSSNRLASGEVQFLFEETLTAKAGQRGALEVPERFELGLEPFEGGGGYPVMARFRYRLAEGELKLGYRLVRADHARDEAFTDICTEIAAGVGLPVYAGNPRS